MIHTLEESWEKLNTSPDKVKWYNISQCQKLSESFIEKHADRVDWKYNQSISEAIRNYHRKTR